MKTKKLISFITTLCFAFSTLGIFTVFAEDMPLDDIIEISSLEELENFRNQVNGVQTYEGKTVVLTEDIDMSATYGENKRSGRP